MVGVTVSSIPGLSRSWSGIVWCFVSSRCRGTGYRCVEVGTGPGGRTEMYGVDQSKRVSLGVVG